MTATFTTVAKVKSRLKKYQTTITDNEITEFIEQAEALVKATMRGAFTATFVQTKHGIIERVTTDLAAFYLLTYDPSSFSSITEVSVIADLLWTSIEDGMRLISDDRVVAYLNGL